MSSLTPAEIREKFAAACRSAESSRTILALPALSKALADLRNAGIDTSMTLHSASSEQAFSLAFDIPHAKYWQSQSGVLHIGNNRHLVAFISEITTESSEKAPRHNCLYLLVSKFDIRTQGHNETVRGNTYDLYQNGIAELQEFIIALSGLEHAIAKADKHGSFNRSAGKTRAAKKGAAARAEKPRTFSPLNKDITNVMNL